MQTKTHNNVALVDVLNKCVDDGCKREKFRKFLEQDKKEEKKWLENVLRDENLRAKLSKEGLRDKKDLEGTTGTLLYLLDQSQHDPSDE